MEEFKINALEPELKPNSSGIDEPGTWYAKAFLRHQRCAEVLSENKLFEDAFAIEMLAAECLLKAVLSVVRFNLFGEAGNLSPAYQLLKHCSDIPSQKNEAQRHPLMISNFGHDLLALTEAVRAVLPEFNKESPLKDFNVFVHKHPIQFDWVSHRYMALGGQPPNCKSWEKAYHGAAQSTRHLHKKYLSNIFGDSDVV